MAPIPGVSAHGAVDDDDECPVCLEPLSFSFRLPGEKPHIVPECGHALHEACFTAVYGPPPNQSRSVPRKSSVGVCGVCRRPMKVGDGDGGKSNKLAALTGMGDSRNSPMYPGRDTPTTRARSQSQPYDPTKDDPLDHAKTSADSTPYIVAPSIEVRPEFSSLTRSNEASQPLTCLVVIELPARRAPAPLPPDNYRTQSLRESAASPHSGRSSPHTAHTESTSRQQQHNHRHPPESSRGASPQSFQNRPLTTDSDIQPTYGNHSLIHSEEDSPFAAITEDLRNRIIDWKGHPLSDLGPLQMKRSSVLSRKKKKGLSRLLGETNSIPSMAGQSKGVLRLKGRIYVRHIKNVTASSAAGEMSLTIDMEDELASFILIFKERASMDAWKNNIQALVTTFQRQNGIMPQASQQQRPPDLEEFGGSAKAMRMLSGSTHTSMSTVDSLLNTSTRSTVSSSTSHNGSLSAAQHQTRPLQHKLSTLGEEEDIIDEYDYSRTPAPPSPVPFVVAPHTGPSNSLEPLPHPPYRPYSPTLDFLVASLGKKDRLSVVTFEVGPGGRVRKTPFLNVGRDISRRRLEKFIDETGLRLDENQDEFLVRGSKEEKTDVVTAVNHGLDVVLQRKARNPISGLVLVSDASDSTRRAQMDLVLARAEAANVPIHSFGYGRSHDPASLWLMSNHTSGTYTFVKDWYDLRGCIAGCVGGMMSIGLLNMKLHMKIVDSYRFRIRKVSGGPSSILASDGQNVDVDIGELRYGERKEMLIELELDNTDVQKAMARQGNGSRGHNRAMDATDRFVQSLGLDSLAIDDGADLVDGMMDRMIDEVPVVEVDGSFLDPAAGKHVSRLAHPVLLTITLLPNPGGAQKPPPAPNSVSDPVIVRRRMELLASDMITRALVLVSRRNFPQAQKIMGETKRILHTVLQTISRTLPPPSVPTGYQGGARNRKEQLTIKAVQAMQSILQDLQLLSEALEDNVELFAHDQRNFGAQQAMILRDQKSWSNRSATERLFWTTDNSIELASRAADWVPRE
ncbi:hypothetical protein H1R20_g6248, partial [Candolleomyces eurysporus]